jgi:putative FmdB family regulatory protein
MPLYEYQCQGCQHEFEQLVWGGQQVSCPQCNGAQVEKLFSVVANPVSGDSPNPGSRTLPTMGGGCGRPQCGTGGCQGL